MYLISLIFITKEIKLNVKCLMAGLIESIENTMKNKKKKMQGQQAHGFSIRKLLI